MPSNDPCLADAESRARAPYSESGRHYHGPAHLDDCLSRLDRVDDLNAGDRQLLRWAILWHDAVYDPARGDNEERSAELARAELLACAVEPAAADEVARLILLTRGHQVAADDRLGALLVSIDLSVLGAEWQRYREYTDAVRREYAHVSDAAWRAGRASVLRHLLGLDPLYPDPAFRTELEAQARKNMATELRALGEG